jgi:hypothetical protein
VTAEIELTDHRLLTDAGHAVDLEHLPGGEINGGKLLAGIG